MIASKTPERMTLGTFLEWDDGTDTRYELFNGVPVAMAPPAPRHGLIAPNVITLLARHLRPPCRAYSEIGVVFDRKRNNYFQPDIAVSCTPLTKDAKAIVDPKLVVEILSPSTSESDLRVKLPAYRAIASIDVILVVDSRRRLVEVQRRAGATWTIETIETNQFPEERPSIEVLGIDLPLGDIYDGVPFEEE